MRPHGDHTAEDIGAHLEADPHQSLLRFITCGSVDDGKSTLIGRLLDASGIIHEEPVASLAAEHKQDNADEVAYRVFTTEKRKFIVADAPGHENYTRNMATGASTAHVAIVLVDASRGLLPQTRRHAFIAYSFGIRHIVLAVNKMDLVYYDEAIFNQIVADFHDFADELGPDLEVEPVPLSALKGDNIIDPSEKTPWYFGPSLLEYLETVPSGDARRNAPFRMLVHGENQSGSDFCGFYGQIAAGRVRPGDRIRALPSGKESRVARVVTADGDREDAVAGQFITLALEDEINSSRGEVIACAETPPEVSDQFQVRVLWMSEHPLLPGRKYVFKIGAKQVRGTVNAPKYAIDINTLDDEPARTLELNEFGVTTIALDEPIAFDAFNHIRETGAFVILDRLTNDMMGMGLIDFALRRASNIRWQQLDIDRVALSEQKGQKPAVLWFTGLSGAGKSTIANQVQKRLYAMGRHTYMLDGDNVRHGLNRDLGFKDADRVENIRRISHVAKLMADAGLIVLVSFISPFRSERQMARNLMADGEFVEIYVDTPLEVAEARDVKGLYKKARAGEIKNFTGIDSPYEPPLDPEIAIETLAQSPDESADLILRWLQQQDFV